jgi:putative hemolysin
MTAIAFIFTPFVKILDLSGRSIFRLFGQKSYTQDQLTEEEMHAILAEGKETGVLHESEHEMFRRIMRLSDRDVRSFMTPRIDISSLPHDESLIALRALALEGGHSRYPVIDGDLDHIIGILDTRDLLALNNVDDPFIWRKSLHTPLVIPENASGLQTLEIFKNSSLPIAVIVDEYGTTQGLVTAADLLEAIIGVLPSNYDDEDPLIFARDSSSWLIDGAAPVDEALEAIGIDQPQNNGEYQTFAGFVLHHLAKEPLLGTTCHFENFVFEIIDMDGRRIDKILVTLKAAKDNDSRI